MRGITTNAAGTRITGHSITAPQNSTASRSRVVGFGCQFSHRHSAKSATFEACKTGSLAAPRFAVLLGRPQNRLVLADYDWPGFAADAHRMRGVISLCLALSPVESYRLFPWQVSSRYGVRRCLAECKRNRVAGMGLVLEAEEKRNRDSQPNLCAITSRTVIRAIGRGPQTISLCGIFRTNPGFRGSGKHVARHTEP